MYVNQTPIWPYKSGKSIKTDSANSITQFPTITSSCMCKGLLYRNKAQAWEL